MALHPGQSSWRNAAHAAAFVGVTATAALASLGAWDSARAQTVTQPRGPAKALPFTPQECIQLFSESSRSFKGFSPKEFNEEFPASIAGFIAPKNPTPVYKIIVNGNVSDLIADMKSTDAKKAQAAIRTLQEAKATMTCDGPPFILTKDNAIDHWNSIQYVLGTNKERPLDVHAKGLRSVDPAEVASIVPATPTTASLGRRSQVITEKPVVR